MKRNPKYVSVATALALAGLLALGSGFSLAQNRAGKQWWTSDKARQQLGLTDDQIEQIGALQQVRQERLTEIRRDEARALREMVGVLDDPSTPPDMVTEKREQLDEILSKHLQVTIDHWISLRQILTTEQWKELPNVAPQVLRIGMLRLRARSVVQVPATD